MSSPLPLEQEESVRHWLASAGHDKAPEDYRQRILGDLAAFSSRTGKTPDELVAFCFLKKKATGERFLSVKRREAMNEWIEEFVAAEGLTGKEAVVTGNTIRGFLIHNGVAIQGGVWRPGS